MVLIFYVIFADYHQNAGQLKVSQILLCGVLSVLFDHQGLGLLDNRTVKYRNIDTDIYKKYLISST